MGRRKKPIREIQRGSLYMLDRRRDYVTILREVKSRQHSKNLQNNNQKFFRIKKGIANTILVNKNETLFGRKYLNVLLANEEGDVLSGFITLSEFLSVIAGTPKWKVVTLEG
jgi:hypothetical protein